MSPWVWLPDRVPTPNPMKRTLTMTAVAALTVGVSLPAAALPSFPESPSTTAAPKLPPQAFVAAASTPATPVTRDAFGVEMIVKAPAPVASVALPTAAFVGSLTQWPLNAPVNDGFGYRSDGFHKGIDIMGQYGSTFYAASAGVVTQVSYEAGWGYYIRIDHGGGVSTLYSHAIEGSPMVSVGQAVDAGTPLALVGDTGYTTAPNMHFEVYVDGVVTDPIPWLP